MTRDCGSCQGQEMEIDGMRRNEENRVYMCCTKFSVKGRSNLEMRCRGEYITRKQKKLGSMEFNA